MRNCLSSLFDELFPICRSITGPGLEASLEILKRHMPLEVEKVPSGEQVFDWLAPPEWHFKRAVLTGPEGENVLDSDHCNLHVVNYSEPVDRQLTLDELQNHLHSLPDIPEAIPYVTSYYERRWGFCLSQRQRQGLKPGLYHAKIEAEFKPEGGVPFASCVLEGESDKEIVLASYLCHPSLANNELSGPLTLLALYQKLQSWPRRKYTYRFVVNPETIGSLCFLSRYHEHLQAHMIGGLILTCLGGPQPSLSYKFSRTGNSLLDQAVRYAEQNALLPLRLRAFSPQGGSDERQYCAPGFNLPMGQIARTVYGEYQGYHNSLDTKAFMGIDQLLASAEVIERLLQLAEEARFYENLAPYGEPQLGKRGLYPNVNSPLTWSLSNDALADSRTILNRILIALNYSDGQNSLYNIAAECGCKVEELDPVVQRLVEASLLKERSPLPGKARL